MVRRLICAQSARLAALTNGAIAGGALDSQAGGIMENAAEGVSRTCG